MKAASISLLKYPGATKLIALILCYGFKVLDHTFMGVKEHRTGAFRWYPSFIGADILVIALSACATFC